MILGHMLEIGPLLNLPSQVILHHVEACFRYLSLEGLVLYKGENLLELPVDDLVARLVRFDLLSQR